MEQAVLWQIEHLKDAGMSYSVKKKWNIIASGGENYMCKIAQNQGVYLGCYVNVKSILEPFSSITMGKKQSRWPMVLSGARGSRDRGAAR